MPFDTFFYTFVMQGIICVMWLSLLHLLSHFCVRYCERCSNTCHPVRLTYGEERCHIPTLYCKRVYRPRRTLIQTIYNLCNRAYRILNIAKATSLARKNVYELISLYSPYNKITHNDTARTPHVHYLFLTSRRNGDTWQQVSANKAKIVQACIRRHLLRQERHMMTWIKSTMNAHCKHPVTQSWLQAASKETSSHGC